MLPIARQREIAAAVLGQPIDEDGWAPCPGAAYHTTGNGRRDFRLFFREDEKPHEHCFHASCRAARDAYMSALYKALAAEERAAGTGSAPRRYKRPAAQPIRRPQPPRPELDGSLAALCAEMCPCDVNAEFLARRSPVEIPEDPSAWPRLMLENLYRHGETVLVFTKRKSQGDFARLIGEGWVRLLPEPGSEPLPLAGELPRRSAEGLLYLTAPVTGFWEPNPNHNGRPGRRHAACCTRYPYAVLESDNLPAHIWLRIVAQLTDPIAAIYTSGSKSIHALVAVNAASADEFNRARASLLRRLVPIGADPAAITAVRLSRLPGGIRAEKITETNDAVQRLLYLNPHPTNNRPIYKQPLRR